MSPILTLICGLAYAEPAENDTLPPAEAELEKEDSNTETEADNAKPSEEQAPATKPPPKEGSLISIEVKLTNGLNIDGEIERKEAISWNRGQPLKIWAEGEWIDLNGDSIDSISTSKPPSQINTSSSGPTPVVVQIKEEPLPQSTMGFDYPNYTASRYLYSPSALSLKKGNGYVSQKMVFFTSGAYGVTDNLTILGGTLTFFPPAMSILGVKYGVDVSDNVRIGVGGETFMSAFDDFGNGMFLANIGFANITIGNEDRNVTVAAGTGSINQNLSFPVALSGLYRLSSAMSLVTENWLILDSDGSPTMAVPSVAFRYMSRPKTGGDGYGGGQFVDFGFFGFFDLSSNGGDGALAPFPWIDFGSSF